MSAISSSSSEIKPTYSLKDLETYFHTMMSHKMEVWFRESQVFKISTALGLFPRSHRPNHTSYTSVRVLRKVILLLTIAMIPVQIPIVKAAFEVTKFMSGVMKVFSTYSLNSSLAIIALHLRALLKTRPVIVRRTHKPVSPLYYKTITVVYTAQSAGKFLLALVNVVAPGTRFDNRFWYFNAACHELSDMTVILIIHQFCGIVDTLSEFQRCATVRLRQDVQAGVRCAEKIHDLFDSYKELFGWQIGWAVIHYFFKIIFTSYYVWSSWVALEQKKQINSVNVWTSNLVRNTVSVPFMFVPIFLSISTCQNMKNNVEAFYNELYQIMRKNGTLCKDNKLWLFATQRRTASFTACGFITLGNPLITSISAAAITYLVILMQFSVDDG